MKVSPTFKNHAYPGRTTVKKLLAKLLLACASAAIMSATAMAEDMPKKIGYVTNYATHEWYQNVIKGMKDHAAGRMFP